MSYQEHLEQHRTDYALIPEGVPSPKKMLTEKQVEAEYGISHRTLQAWRAKGGGPCYHKFGVAVRYSREDVEAYLKARRIVPGAKNMHKECVSKSAGDSSAGQGEE